MSGRKQKGFYSVRPRADKAHPRMYNWEQASSSPPTFHLNLEIIPIYINSKWILKVQLHFLLFVSRSWMFGYDKTVTFRSYPVALSGVSAGPDPRPWSARRVLALFWSLSTRLMANYFLPLFFSKHRIIFTTMPPKSAPAPAASKVTYKGMLTNSQLALLGRNQRFISRRVRPILAPCFPLACLRKHTRVFWMIRFVFAVC